MILPLYSGTSFPMYHAVSDCTTATCTPPPATSHRVQDRAHARAREGGRIEKRAMCVWTAMEIEGGKAGVYARVWTRIELGSKRTSTVPFRRSSTRSFWS
eukprot:1805266-Rhodomonas_salina.1